MKKLIIFFIIPTFLFIGCSGSKSGSGGGGGDPDGEEVQDKTPGFHAEIGKADFSYKISYYDENGRRASKIEILSITDPTGKSAVYASNPEPDNGTAEFRFPAGVFVYENYDVSAQISYEDGFQESKDMNLTAFDTDTPVSDNLSATIKFRSGNAGGSVIKIGDFTLVNIETPGEAPSFTAKDDGMDLTFPKEGLYAFDILFSNEGVKYSHRYDMLMGGEDFIENSVKFLVNKAEGLEYDLDVPITVTYNEKETYPSNMKINWTVKWQNEDGSKQGSNSGSGTLMYFNAKTAYDDMEIVNYAATATLSPIVNGVTIKPKSYQILALYMEPAYASPDGTVQTLLVGYHPEFSQQFEAKQVWLLEDGVKTIQIPIPHPESSVINYTVTDPSPDKTYAIEADMNYNDIDYAIKTEFNIPPLTGPDI